MHRGADVSLARRRAYRDELIKILPSTGWPQGRINAVDKMWEDWLERSGELPPDFEAMPSIPELPDPLVIVENGRRTPIRTVAQWRKQREWIRAQFEQWVFGRMPPPPDNLRATVTDRRREGPITVEEVLLEFGPEHRGILHLQVLIPPGAGPFPTFLTNHTRKRPWVNVALRRGYLGCIYSAAETTYIPVDDADKWIEVYPDYDFSCQARWAWGAMRAVDYLYTLPVVDTKKIAISAHSRNSKTSLLAAAFDERITAVIPSRGCTGAEIPWRYATAPFVNETLEEITRYFSHWFHPRLRFFAGREHKLPVDQNMLMALVAPRGLLFSHAYTEGQGNPWGVEQNYRSVRRVYRLLGHEERLGLYQQPGEHASAPEDVERYFDFTDSVFGLKTFPKIEIWINGYAFENWQAASKDSIDPARYPTRRIGDFIHPDLPAAEWPQRRSSIHERIHWLMGKEPPGVPYRVQPSLRPPRYLSGMNSSGFLATLLPRPMRLGAGAISVSIGFGDDLRGDLYYYLKPDPQPPTTNRPTSARGRLPAGTKLPLVLWLHPHSYATGYSRHFAFILDILTRRGFAVFAFDQIGFGTRVQQARTFYERFPKWSLLGKMVTDTRAALDAVVALAEIDTSKVYLLGYELGAKVGLFTAALDDRVTGLAACCGFAPLRLHTPRKGTEGLRHYSHLHGLLPRVGHFVGQEARLPVDYDEILACIAPRPMYLIAPTLDRHAPVEDVRLAVAAARQVYRFLGREDQPELKTPLGFNGFLLEWNWQTETAAWLAAQAGVPDPSRR